VPNLSPNDVTVADTAGRVLSSPGTSAGATSTRQMQQASDYQRQLGADASAMLAQVFGPGHAVVRVSANLNFDETQKQTDSYANNTTAPVLNQQKATETFSGTGTPPSGTLGVTGAPAATTTGSNNTYNKDDSSTVFGVDHTVQTSKSAPGKVERLSAAVVLDASAKPVPPADKVEKLVGAALGLDTARGDTIVVDTIAFDTTTAKAAKAAKAKADGAASTNTLLGYVRTAVGALALLLVLFFLSRGLKKKTEPLALPAVGPGSVAAAIAAAQANAAGALGPGAADGLAAALGAAGAAGVPTPTPVLAAVAAGTGLAPTATGGLPTEFQGAGAGNEEELLRLIDQQPEEMALLLRTWLADRRS
jgi:flagellar M-ring protein FliF